jgi:adenylate kinase
MVTVGGPRVVLLGKQGAGKGTQAARVAEHYGVVHLATGDIFRAAARDETELGIEARKYIDRGELVPDSIVIGVVREHLMADDHALVANGFVLDGLPAHPGAGDRARRRARADALHVVANLDVPTEVVLRRIAGRRVCVQCGTTYHIDQPPKDPWFCDVCGGHVVQRDDDTEDAVMRPARALRDPDAAGDPVLPPVGRLPERRRRRRERRSVQGARRGDRVALGAPGVITRKTRTRSR